MFSPDEHIILPSLLAASEYTKSLSSKLSFDVVLKEFVSIFHKEMRPSLLQLANSSLEMTTKSKTKINENCVKHGVVEDVCDG